MNLDKRIILAADVDNYEAARELLEKVGNEIYAVKLGLEFGNAEGWEKARKLGDEFGLRVFMDTKTKDIDATVEKASRSLMKHAPAMFTIMADNTQTALEAAVRGEIAGREFWKVEQKAIIIGVTVLTSINDDECISIYGADARTKVPQFSRTAKAAGINTIVCSPEETAMVKAIGGLTVINPAIRPKWAQANDQKRFMTPTEAIHNGADYLVIGRPISSPPPEIGTPINAINLINQEIMEALA